MVLNSKTQKCESRNSEMECVKMGTRVLCLGAFFFSSDPGVSVYKYQGCEGVQHLTLGSAGALAPYKNQL